MAILSAPKVASQQPPLAITLGSGSWHRLPTAVPICKGSSLKWFPLAVSSITKLQGSNNSPYLEGHLPPFLPLVPVSCFRSTISRGSLQQVPRRAVIEWNHSLQEICCKIGRLKNLSYRI